MNTKIVIVDGIEFKTTLDEKYFDLNYAFRNTNIDIQMIYKFINSYTNIIKKMKKNPILYYDCDVYFTRDLFLISISCLSPERYQKYNEIILKKFVQNGD